MTEEKVDERDDIPEKKGFITWVKEHKTEILLTGVSVSTIIMTILGIKNKNVINALWESKKKK